MCDLGISGCRGVKNLPANVGDTGNLSWIPGSGRSPGEGNGNPLQYSCLENSVDRRAWQATVHRVTKSWIQLSTRTCVHARTHIHTRTHTWDLSPQTRDRTCMPCTVTWILNHRTITEVLRFFGGFFFFFFFAFLLFFFNEYM